MYFALLSHWFFWEALRNTVFSSVFIFWRLSTLLGSGTHLVSKVNHGQQWPAGVIYTLVLCGCQFSRVETWPMEMDSGPYSIQVLPAWYQPWSYCSWRINPSIHISLHSFSTCMSHVQGSAMTIPWRSFHLSLLFTKDLKMTKPFLPSRISQRNRGEGLSLSFYAFPLLVIENLILTSPFLSRILKSATGSQEKSHSDPTTTHKWLYSYTITLSGI